MVASRSGVAGRSHVSVENSPARGGKFTHTHTHTHKPDKLTLQPEGYQRMPLTHLGFLSFSFDQLMFIAQGYACLCLCTFAYVCPCAPGLIPLPSTLRSDLKFLCGFSIFISLMCCVLSSFLCLSMSVRLFVKGTQCVLLVCHSQQILLVFSHWISHFDLHPLLCSCYLCFHKESLIMSFINFFPKRFRFSPKIHTVIDRYKQLCNKN